MSLTDKIIKNTAYYFLSQIVGLLFPLILTPYIISKIGTEEFAIYALVFGFIGGFSLFDLSISSSFVKFISEHYFRKEHEDLNKVINTGTFFYITFSLIISVIVFFFIDFIVTRLNIPPNLYNKALFALYISLAIFLITNSTSMFSAIITSLQKMYLNSITWVVINLFNTIAIIILLSAGFGLKAVLVSQLCAYTLNTVFTIYFAKANLREMKFSASYVRGKTFKKLFGFGIQMQISKLATFASEKYDEFLLAYFSILNSVTFFNIGSRVSRLGKFLPSQIIPQTAPVAAELKSRNENDKLIQLFKDTTKYLSILSFPVFVFIFVFADLIIYCWMGNGYEISANILRILIGGQLINMVLSAPGNSITPNIGLPKYQMREGLINLLVNLVLSFLLIKYYGIIGAAWGNTFAAVISSLYVFYVSAKYFNVKHFGFIRIHLLKPILISISAGLVFYLLYYSASHILTGTGRAAHVIYLLAAALLYSVITAILFLYSKYITEKDKEIMVKLMMRFLPLKILAEKRKKKFISRMKPAKHYDSELVSFLVVTYNRKDFLEKCISSLLRTLEDINFELLILDNNSSDNTREYLEKLTATDKRIKVIFSEKNTGTGAKSILAEMTSGEYIIGIDDDVWSFPENWVQDLIYAYNSVPGMGYLSTDVIQDETTTGAKAPENAYKIEYYENGKIHLQVGPAGGWCFMISRDIYAMAGKFAHPKNRIFYGEDGEYVLRMQKHGLKSGILKGLKVYHATGPVNNEQYMKIYENKMKDLEHGKNKISVKSLMLNKWFSPKYYYNRLLDICEGEIKKEEGEIHD